MTDAEYRLEGSNYDDQNILPRNDRNADEDKDWNENTGGRPVGDDAKEEGRGGIANNIGGLHVSQQSPMRARQWPSLQTAAD